MRTFPILFITAAFAFTANGGMIGKREPLSPTPQECKDLLNIIQLEYFTMASTIGVYGAKDVNPDSIAQKRQVEETSTFVDAAGNEKIPEDYPIGDPDGKDYESLGYDILRIMNAASTINKASDMAKEKCCSLPDKTISYRDSFLLADLLIYGAGNANMTLDMLKLKRTTFKNGTDMYNFAQDIIVDIPKSTRTFQECLVNKLLKEDRGGIKRIQDSLEKQIIIASIVYDLPVGPSAGMTEDFSSLEQAARMPFLGSDSNPSIPASWNLE